VTILIVFGIKVDRGYELISWSVEMLS